MKLKIFSSNRLPFAVHTITVVRPKPVPELGTAFGGWEDAERFDIEGCSIQPGEKWEDHIRAATAANRFSIWLPIDSDIRSTDRVDFTLHGREYRGMYVDGNPGVWIDPRGIQSHLLINVIDSHEMKYEEEYEEAQEADETMPDPFAPSEDGGLYG